MRDHFICYLVRIDEKSKLKLVQNLRRIASCFCAKSSTANYQTHEGKNNVQHDILEII